MLNFVKKIAVFGTLVASTSVFAAPSMIHLGAANDTGSTMNNFNLTQSGVTVNVSAWSDTAGSNGNYDKVIRRARDLDKYNGGWSVQNRDEANSSGSHLTGNNCYGHSADNFSCTKNGKNETDYDFFLLSFSEEVSLTGARYSWRHGSTSQNQVSVAALSDTSLNGRTWQGVKNNITTKSDSSQMVWSSGYYTDFASTNVGGTYSKYWLIGALNSVFGLNAGDSLHNDGMKLSKVLFDKKKPPVNVPEPSTIILFALACLGLTYTRKKQLA